LVLASIARTFDLASWAVPDNGCGKDFVTRYIEGRSDLGSRTSEAVEVSVATISQGCIGAGQRTNTLVNRDSREKRTSCVRRCF